MRLGARLGHRGGPLPGDPRAGRCHFVPSLLTAPIPHPGQVALLLTPHLWSSFPAPNIVFPGPDTRGSALQFAGTFLNIVFPGLARTECCAQLYKQLLLPAARQLWAGFGPTPASQAAGRPRCQHQGPGDASPCKEPCEGLGVVSGAVLRLCFVLARGSTTMGSCCICSCLCHPRCSSSGAVLILCLCMQCLPVLVPACSLPQSGDRQWERTALSCILMLCRARHPQTQQCHPSAALPACRPHCISLSWAPGFAPSSHLPAEHP